VITVESICCMMIAEPTIMATILGLDGMRGGFTPAARATPVPV
jgi:hypothetical protein